MKKPQYIRPAVKAYPLLNANSLMAGSPPEETEVLNDNDNLEADWELPLIDEDEEELY